MKIEKESDKLFVPVTITLETQDELDFFTQVFYRVGGTEFVKLFSNTSTVRSMLQENGGNLEKYDYSSRGSIYIDSPSKIYE